MKVFISWPGDQSKVLAEVLREWLKTVLAGKVEAFVSSQDIAKRDRGRSAVASSLEDINFGIILLTKELGQL